MNIMASKYDFMVAEEVFELLILSGKLQKLKS